MRVCSIGVGLCVGLFMVCIASTAQPVVAEAAKMPELEALFRYQEPWLGGDAAYSLDISEFRPHTILWTFGDTFWGMIEDNRKVWSGFTNNSVALYNYKDERVDFYPAEPRNLFELTEWVEAGWPYGPWVFAPFIQNGKIYCFLMVNDLAGWTDPLGDWLADIYLAEVVNPKDLPEQWDIDYYPIDFLPVRYEGHSFLWLATDVYVEDDTYYMYGVKQEQLYENGKQIIKRYFVVARTRSEITDFESWEFYNGRGWSSTPQVVDGGPDDLSTEYSVIHVPPFDRYLLVYQRDQLEDEVLRYSIWGRWADTPVGPWGEPKLLYTPPESVDPEFWEEDYWIYAVKAHYPQLSGAGNEIVVSYVISSFDKDEQQSDPLLYCPYFAKLTLAEHE